MADSGTGIGLGNLQAALTTAILGTTAPENIAQVGGSTISSASGTGSLPGLPTADNAQALYLSGTTGVIPTNNAQTILNIPLGSLAGPGQTIFDVRTVSVGIANNATGQTIETASLVFSDTLNGITVSTNPIDIGVGFSVIASGGSAAISASCLHGVLKNANLSVTFTSAPVAGRVDVVMACHARATGVISGTNDGVNFLTVNAIPNLSNGLHAYSIFGISADVFLHAYNATASVADLIQVVPYSGCIATPTSGTLSVAITTSGQVKGSAGVIGSLVNTGSAVSPAIVVYDSTTASGKTIWAGTLTAGQVLPLGMPCGTGIYVTLAVAGTITASYA